MKEAAPQRLVASKVVQGVAAEGECVNVIWVAEQKDFEKNFGWQA